MDITTVDGVVKTISESAVTIAAAIGTISAAIVGLASALAKVFPNSKWLSKVALNPNKDKALD